MLRAGQAIAADAAQTAHRDIAGAIVHREDLRSDARPACLRVFRRIFIIHHLEVQLGRLAEQFLQRLRIVQARHLHHDTVLALPDNGRLARAQLVDTAADHVGGGGHRIVQIARNARFGRSHLKARAVDHANGPVPLPGQPGAGGQPLHRLARRIDLALIGHGKTQAPAGAGNLAIIHAIGIAQRRTDILFHLLQLLLTHLHRIGFQQDVAATGQIETQIDGLLGHEIRQRGDEFGRQQAWQRQHHADNQQQRKEYPPGLGKIEHRSGLVPSAWTLK